MAKTELLEMLNIVRQTVPFLMITAIFVGIAYSYGNTLTPFYMDDSFDLVKLSCLYMP